MKWFKHSSTMSEEDDGAYLLNEHGLEGYARWCLILEIISRDIKNRTFRELPTQEWCTKLKTKEKVLLRFLKQTANKLNIKAEQKDNILRIEVTKVASMRDNYSRNLQATTKRPIKKVNKNSSLDKDIDKEVEVDIDKRSNTEGGLNALNQTIDLFKVINPQHRTFFANKTQRRAVESILKEISHEKLQEYLNIIAETNKDKFAPVITTPLEFLNKKVKLDLYLAKRKVEHSSSVEMYKDLEVIT